MNEAPKKIWVIRDRYVVDPEKVCEHTVPYIRDDIVDDLIKALIAIGAGQGDPKEFAIQSLENCLEKK